MLHLLGPTAGTGNRERVGASLVAILLLLKFMLNLLLAVICKLDGSNLISTHGHGYHSLPPILFQILHLLGLASGTGNRERVGALQAAILLLFKFMLNLLSAVICKLNGHTGYLMLHLLELVAGTGNRELAGTSAVAILLLFTSVPNLLLAVVRKLTGRMGYLAGSPAWSMLWPF
ncbi:hypothetical protein Cgig2_011869 [Carnegiea gigantea]|uniref:Uncharacterized protein n=1 Tax=Carnegiea gigantea TaxID=171969 RepID=A0A9Q1K7C9_9CARY|nr:hypothetical protein Cgig2_011869 [Carnegiea gigantea]